MKLWGDDPIDGSPESPDALGRAGYANHIRTLLDVVRRHGESSVLALIGAWGSGKTSILDMLVREMKADSNPWRVATFNPWLYSGYDALHAGFFSELRAAIPQDERWSDARERIGSLGRRISPLGALVPVRDMSGLISALAQGVEGDTSATAIKKKAEEALEGLGRPVLMVIDDLDRLAPNELLLVLKLVRLVGRLPNVYYLLCYDERTLTDVLARTELVGTGGVLGEQRAQDYLEKIVQIRLDLPPLRARERDRLFDASLKVLLEEYAVTLEDGNWRRFQTAFHDHIGDRLQTPRSVKRFFGQVSAFYPLLDGEVDFVDVLLLTWIRTAEPRLYASLPTYRSDLTSSGSSALYGFARKEPHDERLAIWIRRLEECRVAPNNIDGVLSVLGQMFLSVRSARERMSYHSDHMPEVAQRKGVGHADYFDRYFSFGVPEDDIPDSLVLRAIRDLSLNQSTSDVERLLRDLREDTAFVCRKIEAVMPVEQLPAVQLLEMLGREYMRVSGPGDMLMPPARAMEFLAGDLLPWVSECDGIELIDRMCSNDSGLALIAVTVARASHGSTTPRGRAVVSWLESAKRQVAERISARLTIEAESKHLESVSDYVWDLVWAWKALDEEGCREWLQSDSAWPTRDVIARLVPPSHVSPEYGFPPLDPSVVDGLLGLEWALNRLESEIDAVDPDGVERDDGFDWDARLRVGLRALRRFRAEGGEVVDP